MSVKAQSETVRSLSMRRRTARCAVPAIVLLLVVTSWAAGAEPGAYLGWRNCAACHETIAAEWQLSSHARAFAGLKKSAQETLPACIRCHVTGYEQPGGFIDVELTSDLAGVQCEQCHGSGKNHAAAPGKGTIVASPPVETCRHCHTPGQDPNFDYPKKVRNVHSATASAGRAAWELELRATPQRFDFGTVDEGTPATTTITVQNIGEGPITITDVKTN